MSHCSHCRPKVQRRDPWFPAVWAGIFLLCIVAWTLFIFFVPTTIEWAVAVGDWLGITP